MDWWEHWDKVRRTEGSGEGSLMLDAHQQEFNKPVCLINFPVLIYEEKHSDFFEATTWLLCNFFVTSKKYFFSNVIDIFLKSPH